MNIEFLFDAFSGKNWFWVGFWPNLAATVIGVALGIPIGLWVNRRAERAAVVKGKSDAKQLMHQGLATVQTALLHNRQCLAALHENLVASRAMFDVGLDLAAWSATNRQIIPALGNPDLVRRIAFHFERLASLGKLSGLYLDMVAGIGAAIGGVEQTRETLRTNLVGTSQSLILDAIRLHGEIAVVVNGRPGSS